MPALASASARIHFELLRQAVQAVQSGVITAFGLRRRQVNDAGPFRARSSTPFSVSCPSFCLCVVIISLDLHICAFTSSFL